MFFSFFFHVLKQVALDWASLDFPSARGWVDNDQILILGELILFLGVIADSDSDSALFTVTDGQFWYLLSIKQIETLHKKSW